MNSSLCCPFKDILQLSQKSYIYQTISTFGLNYCTLFDTPGAINFYEELTVHKDEEVIFNTNYGHTIGSLQLLCHRTIHGISTAVGILSQFCNNPTKFLIKIVDGGFQKPVFGYLRKQGHINYDTI